VANDDSNRIFVVEKLGLIKAFENDEASDTYDIFLDLSGDISTVSEQGLLGLAFHPDFSINGFYYVHYNPDRSTSRISRFTANGNTTISGSELILMDIPQPLTNHNGGQVIFGPDGFLYLSIGDGGGAGDPGNNAQNLSNLLGTILRIDVDNPEGGLNYGIPASNPFAGQAGARPEIFAYGLRNPWRMSFDAVTGVLWTGDVGQNEREEIDIISSGGNYGWRLFEASECFSGNCDNSGLEPPVFEYDHSNNDRSITGGFVYRGNQLTTISGKYIYGDFVSGRIWGLETDGSANELLLSTGRSISAFGIDAENELYVCDFDGGIYKFVETEN
jgi:glucose/arabinose dehydrogenase